LWLCDSGAGLDGQVKLPNALYGCRYSCRLVAGFSKKPKRSFTTTILMKWFKAVLIAVPTFFGAAAITVMTTQVASAMYYYSWKWFWKACLEIIIRAINIYLDQVEAQGHWRVSMNSAPLVTLFQGNPADAAIAAENGFGFNGNTLTVTHDIVVHSDGKTGVALQAGEYPIDAKGNFQLDFVRVSNPETSETFPLD
jgi:hypothetical protein